MWSIISDSSYCYNLQVIRLEDLLTCNAVLLGDEAGVTVPRAGEQLMGLELTLWTERGLGTKFDVPPEVIGVWNITATVKKYSVYN